MVAKVHTGTLLGIHAMHVEVEADIARRLPKVTLVGLAEEPVKESSERVRSAIVASGFDFPKMRVTINLAPADLRKSGPGFDLPIALAILAASGQVDLDELPHLLVAGELSLNGALRPIPGALSLAMLARDQGLRGLLLPMESAREAALLPGLEAMGACTLAELVAHLNRQRRIEPASPPPPAPPGRDPDFAEVRGQSLAKRALEVAAAGGHSLLMVGPPGVGKTMLAARLAGILPPLSGEESLEVTCIHSVVGLSHPEAGLIRRRPFRAPHHSITPAGLIGNARLRPGELSLAHNGVLFLDELPEFSRSALEQLRAPLESREVVITRAAGTVALPASVSLIAASNPCPCGYFGHPTRPCECTDALRLRYAAKLSGPLADRFDMLVHVEPLDAQTLMDQAPGEASSKIRTRVVAARGRQASRFRGSRHRCNAESPGPLIRDIVKLSGPARRAMAQATDTMSLSGRAYDKVLKVSRTLADLDGQEQVGVEHIAEALAFRVQDQPACAS